MDLVEDCPFCKAALHHHCHPLNAGCAWLTCKACGTDLDPKRKRATRRGVPVEWPYAEPERGSE